MADTVRLSTWGWFSRAFAAGFGVMFGVFTASLMICLFSYALFAVVAITFSSVSGNGSVRLTPSMASLSPSPTATCTPPLLPAPSTESTPFQGPGYQSNSYVAPTNPYAGTAYGSHPTPRYANTSAAAVPNEADAEQSGASQTLTDDVQYFAPAATFDVEKSDDDDDLQVTDEPLEKLPAVEDGPHR